MKLRKLGTWVVVVVLAIPVCAADRPGAISGYVRNIAGTPQMGAVVQILGAAHYTLTVFTDAAGYYTATGLLPGSYTVKVTAPSFLPAMREKLGLRPGGSLNVNVTLSTLLGMMQLGPVRTLPDEDDWKWTLRSVANRPILRVFDDPAATAEKQGPEMRGSLSFLAGSEAGGYGTGSDMSTGFTLERSIFSEGRLALRGNVAYGPTVPAAVIRSSYSHRMLDGSTPTIGLTIRRFAPVDPNLHNAALQAIAVSAADDFSVGDVLELKFGSELQTIQFLGHINAFRPYGSADLHLSPDTVVEYSYTTSRPDARAEKGFDSAPADLSETDPRVSLVNFASRIESAHHQEVSVSHRMGKNNVQFAAYSDRINNPVLTGAGDVTAASGFLLPDISSGTFSYAGPNLNTSGMRVVLQHKFASDLTATLDYAFGGVLDLSRPDASLQHAQQWISTQRRQAIAAKLSGTVSRTHTRWIASYRWINGSELSPVDMFNASAGQSAPFLNIFIRQPIPSFGGRMEALIDVRNLLAQGYVPVLGQDGRTLYLVDSARSVRGGVAFTF
ncbi:MAG TPA: carboxypeptidase-like regulatory domain-containing protein [Candidatus Sulfotelmatobacter sp.]|nr:carboxypeptidase-like regulatory domain-containing protein [Candidatus Sulfotelmatobacter sp.]